MLDFLRTHRCNGWCRLLGLPANLLFDPKAGAAGTSEHTDLLDSSRNTSAYTVQKTDHLQQRKDERMFTTRQCQQAVKHGVKTVRVTRPSLLRESPVAQRNDKPTNDLKRNPT